MMNVFKRGWVWVTVSRARFSFVLTLAILGLLLWSRLIMLSKLPRTAFADDEAASPDRVTATGSGSPSDKQSRSGTQANPKVDPNDEARGSSNDGTRSVSGSSPDDDLFREEDK